MGLWPADAFHAGVKATVGDMTAAGKAVLVTTFVGTAVGVGLGLVTTFVGTAVSLALPGRRI